MALDDHNQHFMGAVAQKALIQKNGKVLLVQYPKGDAMADKWDLPGGRLHQGESSLEGLKREVFEEIGADIVVEGIIATGVNKLNDSRSIFYVIYKASLINLEQTFVAEADEIGKIEWRDTADFFTLPIIFEGYQKALRGIL